MPHIHTTNHYTIYFGDASNALFPAMYQQYTTHNTDLTASLASIQKTINTSSLFFLKQTHSDHGYCVDTELLRAHNPFALEGDFLITQHSTHGIGIMTADCLPIIAYDTENNALGIAHAGWKGAVQSIGTKMLDAMHAAYGTTPQHVQIIFGPSAHACCYEVDATFYTHLTNYPWWQKTLQTRGEKIFFDLPLYARLQLEHYGVPAHSFNTTYNLCTMCNVQFWSHRRNKADCGRNPTVVTLQ